MLKKTLNTYEQQRLIPALKDCNVWANVLEKSCWQPAVSGSQVDVSCQLLLLHGFVSRVCWQPPLGAQTFKSVFCHGLSSFCYTRVTTTLLFPLPFSVCWLRASSSRSCCPSSFVQSLPSLPLLLARGSCLLEMPVLTQPETWVLHLPIVLSSSVSTSPGLVGKLQTCLCAASSVFAQELVWFSSLSNSHPFIYLPLLSPVPGFADSDHWVSVCRNVVEQNQPSLTFTPQLGFGVRHSVVSRLESKRIPWHPRAMSQSQHRRALGTREGFLRSAWLSSRIPIRGRACTVLAGLRSRWSWRGACLGFPAFLSNHSPVGDASSFLAEVTVHPTMQHALVCAVFGGEHHRVAPRCRCVCSSQLCAVCSRCLLTV